MQLSAIKANEYKRRLCEGDVSICDIPQAYLNYELCQISVVSNPENLKHIPYHFLSKNKGFLIELAVSKKGELISLAPREYLTKGICIIASKYLEKSGDGTKKKLFLESVPSAFLTEDICKKACLADINNIDYVPMKFLNQDLFNYLEESGLDISQKTPSSLQASANVEINGVP